MGGASAESIGAVLHIRMESATGGSAESCENGLMFSFGEILPCAKHILSAHGESVNEKMMICENRGIVWNLESDRGVFSSMCNNLCSRPGKDPDRLRENLTGNSPLSEPCRMSTPPH